MTISESVQSYSPFLEHKMRVMAIIIAELVFLVLGVISFNEIRS